MVPGQNGGTMSRVHARVVAIAVVGVLVVAGGVASGIGSPAQASGQSITATPGPFAGGETVTVDAYGFSPDAPVAISECPWGRALTGPGDCGRSVQGHAMLVTSDATGHASATLTIVHGALNNQTPPSATCDLIHRCVIAAVNISKATEIAKLSISYVLPVSPTLSYSPSTPLKAGQLAYIAATGFTPGAPVSIQQCALDRVPQGPGDCGRSRDGAGKLVVADGRGVARATLVTRVGSLGNQTPPASTCGPDRPCKFFAINIGDVSEQVEAPINFSTTMVTPRIDFRTDATAIWLGATVGFACNVAPNQDGQRVYLQRHTTSGWVTVSSQELGLAPSCRGSWKPGAASIQWLRLALRATRYHPAAHSASKRLEVVG